MRGKIYVIDIGDYDRDPTAYHKHDYSPFGQASTTWRVFYMSLLTKRKRLRAYASYGRTYQEALRGLEVATELSGFRMISKEKYIKLGGEQDDE
jgi:hypothetical protein